MYSCVITNADRSTIKQSFVSIYSFLRENSWFNGNIFVFCPENEINDEDKDVFISLYNNTYFVDDNNYRNLRYAGSSQIDFNAYEVVILVEDNFLVTSDISRHVDSFQGILTRDNMDPSIIVYDKETEYYKSCEEEIKEGGPFYTFYNFDKVLRFPKDFNDRHKYVTCTCAKNENDYIVEWVEHYLNLGFDKIFFCDNNEVGDDSLSETLYEYIDKGLVEIFDCRELDCFQVQFYSMFCTDGNYKWCGYFDCDEFLELPSHFNVKHYIESKGDEKCLSFHWMVYGSNGVFKKEEGTLSERFPFPVSPISIFTENCFVKSIVKGEGEFRDGCFFNGSHIPTTTPMYTHNVGGYFHTDSPWHCYFPPKYKDGYIRHYYTKSFGEWCRKSRRGWPDGTTELVLNNFFVCEDWANLPIERMRMGLFSEYRGKEENKQYYGVFTIDSNVIDVKNESQNIYALIMGMYNIMSSCSNHVFILSGEHIDDTVFNMILEYGIKTGNKVVWASTEEDRKNIGEKYSNNKHLYYTIEFS